MKTKAFIEIDTGSYHKYEYNQELKLLELNRVIKLPYPANYGFIPSTLSEDKDPTDVFVVSSYPLMRGALCTIEIVGAYSCLDNDVPDDKLVGYIVNDSNYRLNGQIEQSDYTRIRDFLINYKNGFEVLDFVAQYEAIKIYEKSAKAFQEQTDNNV
jgi:inorganic pyrophosphatase